MAPNDGLPGINLLVLYCTDVEACRDFYVHLGLSFVNEQHGSGPEHLAAEIGNGCVIELYPAGKKGPTDPLRIGLSVSASLVDLEPGQHILRDPDRRAVVVDVAN
jgi:catechol 2,3-dioxygenase-like lactoylglutathione lyase family enzyme